MQQTMVEKIFQRKIGSQEIKPGQFVTLPISQVMIHDLFISSVWEKFKQMGFKKIWDAEKIVLIYDHLVPTSRMEDSKHHTQAEAFVKEMGIKKIHRTEGICHQLMMEKGYARPGEIVVGTDSHTTTYGAGSVFSTGIGYTEMAAVLGTGKMWFRVPETIRIEIEGKLSEDVSSKDMILRIIGDLGTDGANYKVLEFGGSGIKALSMSSRMTMSNMAIECGAKAGIFEADEVAAAYYGIPMEDIAWLKPDKDATYSKVLHYQAENFKVVAACPGGVDQVKPLSELVGQKLDEVFIGSCTNGRLEDLRTARDILKGKKVDPSVRCIVFPGTQQIYLDAIKEGIVTDLIEAGAVFSTSTCGPCLGGHMGILAAGERAVSTTNRNFVGRMGHVDSEVYLASPAVAAASAVTGYITNPEDL